MKQKYNMRRYYNYQYFSIDFVRKYCIIYQSTYTKSLNNMRNS